MKNLLLACVVFTYPLMGGGCQGVASCGDIDALTRDDDGDGFLEVVPPEGVAFDPAMTVSFLGENTLIPTDLLPHVQEVNLSPSAARVLIDLTDFIVTFSFDVDYGSGRTQTICQTEPFAPFRFAFEAVCPVDSQLTVEATAVLPILGGIPIATFPIGLTTDAVDFMCGQTVSLKTTKNEAGEVV